MENINLKVKTLKEILEDLPDDMDVIIPVIDYDDPNSINGFRHVRTIGILECEYEKSREALCLNASDGGLDISSQITWAKYHADRAIKCKKVLF